MLSLQSQKQLSQICIDSYEGHYGEDKHTLKDRKEYRKGHVKFFMGKLDDAIVVVFPGSRELFDWFDNLNFQKNKWFGRGKVHRGFCHQFSEISMLLDSAIEEYVKMDRKLIIFMGHSLGGAIATLATDFYIGMNQFIVCYTEGSPRVGNYRFVRNFNKRVYNSYRIVNGADPVPKLPTWWMGFRHVKGKIKIGQKLSWREKLLWLPRKIFGNPADHYPQRYLGNLEW